MKEIWNDKDKRKGLIGTILAHLILLVLFIFLGLKYYEPKPEEGIVINWGTSATGIGDEADGAPQPQAQPQEEQAQPTAAEAPTEPVTSESPTLTQNVEDAPSLKKEDKKPRSEPQPKQQEQPKEPTPEELEQQRLEQERAEKRRQLEERFGKVSDAKAGGEGEKEGPGDQGDPSGDPDSPSRTGSTGGGSGGGAGDGAGGDGDGYLLKGRMALAKPNPSYNCQDYGTVVVEILVDRNGKVVSATPGVKTPGGRATTSTSSCLYSRAKNAAMSTKWSADPDALEYQKGYIIYKFTKN